MRARPGDPHVAVVDPFETRPGVSAGQLAGDLSRAAAEIEDVRRGTQMRRRQVGEPQDRDVARVGAPKGIDRLIAKQPVMVGPVPCW